MKRKLPRSKKDFLRSLDRRGPRRRPPGKSGGSEAVPVEPDRPKLGEGGAAAALEYDDPA